MAFQHVFSENLLQRIIIERTIEAMLVRDPRGSNT